MIGLGHGLLGGAGHGRQEVAQEIDAAPLPPRLGKDLGNGSFEALVGVGDCEPQPLELALDEVPQEARPEERDPPKGTPLLGMRC